MMLLPTKIYFTFLFYKENSNHHLGREISYLNMFSDSFIKVMCSKRELELVNLKY